VHWLRLALLYDVHMAPEKLTCEAEADAEATVLRAAELTDAQKESRKPVHH
jgi:F0F1-type ATP synthase delta subunit